jgi:hypothetical protein
LSCSPELPHLLAWPRASHRRQHRQSGGHFAGRRSGRVCACGRGRGVEDQPGSVGLPFPASRFVGTEGRGASSPRGHRLGQYARVGARLHLDPFIAMTTCTTPRRICTTVSAPMTIVTLSSRSLRSVIRSASAAVPVALVALPRKSLCYLNAARLPALLARPPLGARAILHARLRSQKENRRGRRCRRPPRSTRRAEPPRGPCS